MHTENIPMAVILWLCAAVAIGGAAALIFAYGRIYRKYERKTEDDHAV